MSKNRSVSIRKTFQINDFQSVIISNLSTPLCLEQFHQFMVIYQDSIDPSEQQTPDELLEYCLEDTHLFGFIVDNNILVGGSVYWFDKSENIGLLAYLAVDSKTRSSGYGGKLLSQCNQYLFNELNVKNVLIEVDSVNEKNISDLEIRVKRQSFYTRNGAKKIMDFKYRLPFMEADYYPEMEFQIISSETINTVSAIQLQSWIKLVYMGVYRETSDHPYVSSMFINSPDLYFIK